MKNIIFSLIAIAATFHAFGREITGTVVGEGNTPLDFVNVVLYQDSAYITGAITDTNGNIF